MIIQSGSVLGSFAVHDATMDFPKYIRDVGKMFDCHFERSEPLVKCLRSVPWEQFIDKRKRARIFTFSFISVVFEVFAIGFYKADI